MKSLRGMVLVGAGLWTVGLLAIWAVSITLNRGELECRVETAKSGDPGSPTTRSSPRGG